MPKSFNPLQLSLKQTTHALLWVHYSPILTRRLKTQVPLLGLTRCERKSGLALLGLAFPAICVPLFLLLLLLIHVPPQLLWPLSPRASSVPICSTSSSGSSKQSVVFFSSLQIIKALRMPFCNPCKSSTFTLKGDVYNI